MLTSHAGQTWPQRLGAWAGELLVIFIGVSAAFVVDNYRDNRSQAAELHQAVAGIVTELDHYQARAGKFADAIDSRIAAWEKADRAGQRAIPAYFRIPGADHPPSAAWTTAVASGVARMLEPELRMDLGYFYSEFVGIHENYARFNAFTEREVLPRALEGPDAFYGPDGKLLPMFRVHMQLQAEFAADLRRLGGAAHDLRARLAKL